MEVTGHKTRAVFDRYNVINRNDLRGAQRKMKLYKKMMLEESKRRDCNVCHDSETVFLNCSYVVPTIPLGSRGMRKEHSSRPVKNSFIFYKLLF